MNFNKIIIAGRLTRDPEWKDVGNGLCRFSVAVGRSWKDKNSGEWQERTSYFDVALWGKSGQYQMDKLFKGAQVIVSGEMESSKKDDKVYWTITPEFGGVKILNPKSRGAEVGVAKPVVEDDDGDLPF